MLSVHARHVDARGAENVGPGSVKVPLARGEVGARAERRRRTGQHDDADRVAAVAPPVGVGEFLAHAVAERVALRGRFSVMVATPRVDGDQQRAVNGQVGRG